MWCHCNVYTPGQGRRLYIQYIQHEICPRVCCVSLFLFSFVCLFVCSSSDQFSYQTVNRRETYHRTPNINYTLIGNKSVHHSDVVRPSPVSAATSSLSTSGLNGLAKVNRKASRESFKILVFGAVDIRGLTITSLDLDYEFINHKGKWSRDDVHKAFTSLVEINECNTVDSRYIAARIKTIYCIQLVRPRLDLEPTKHAP